MRKYLLDTNICIHLLRGEYHVDERINEAGFDNCYISEITVAELYIGEELARQKGTNKRQGLSKFLSSIHVLPISNVLELFAKEKVRLRLAGTPIDDNFDLLIGCTAVANKLIMVTENVKDFKNIKSIHLENWINRNN